MEVLLGGRVAHQLILMRIVFGLRGRALEVVLLIDGDGDDLSIGSISDLLTSWEEARSS